MTSAIDDFRYPFKFIHSMTPEICKRGISIAYSSLKKKPRSKFSLF